jgi:hypothetical protein
MFMGCGGLQKRQGTKTMAQTQLNLIMFQVENGIIHLNTMDDDEYIELALNICKLIDEKGGVKSKKEHYFRNHFSRGPNTLSEMVDTIAIGDNRMFCWQLMPLEDTVFHMLGINGEYNLKFISGNGYFEVIYNKNGEKLTIENDPLNMGTFNYANQNKSSIKHYQYDIEPFLKWGNTENVKVNADTITNSYETEEILNRYNEYYTLMYRNE